MWDRVESLVGPRAAGAMDGIGVEVRDSGWKIVPGNDGLATPRGAIYTGRVDEGQ